MYGLMPLENYNYKENNINMCKILNKNLFLKTINKGIQHQLKLIVSKKIKRF